MTAPAGPATTPAMTTKAATTTAMTVVPRMLRAATRATPRLASAPSAWKRPAARARAGSSAPAPRSPRPTGGKTDGPERLHPDRDDGGGGDHRHPRRHRLSQLRGLQPALGTCRRQGQADGDPAGPGALLLAEPALYCGTGWQPFRFAAHRPGLCGR